MKTNIIRTILTCAFLIGVLTMNAQTKIYVHKTDGTATEFNIADIDSISFTAPEEGELIDYSPLVLNEISGEHKFVEIYNSGTDAISLKGVKLERNAGMSSWTGTSSDVIAAGAYGLFLFNSTTVASDHPAKIGTVGSGISDQQILKVALVDPEGNEFSVFIRGDVPLPPWQDTMGVSRDRDHSYSRMPDGTWAYADPTPGEENGENQGEIIDPGYLTAQPE